jgi:Outer membrane lipoprotein carrier protein LolA-like
MARSALTAMLLGWPLASRALDAATLIGSLKKPVPANTRYTEVRFVSVLDKPLLLRGVLEFQAIDDMSKRVESPYKELTHILGEQVEVRRDDNNVRRFSLKRAPELKGFLSGFAALLSGDAELLGKAYEIAISGDDAGWRIVLTPRDEALIKRIHSLIVDGAQAKARCFTIDEADGDASIMLVEALAATTLPKPLTRESVQAVCRTTTAKAP